MNETTTTSRIREMRSKGMTGAEIIKKLNESGLKTPKGVTWKPWTYNAFVSRHVLQHSTKRKKRANKVPPFNLGPTVWLSGVQKILSIPGIPSSTIVRMLASYLEACPFIKR